MEFDQKEETPFNIPEKKKTDKKTLAVYIGAGVITVSSVIFGYANYQATYFKDMEIKNLKTQLDDANTKLQRIDVLETQIKELEASLVAKSAVKPTLVKKTKILSKKETKKVTPSKKVAKKTKLSKVKEKKPVKK
jgi:hypothetical protein